MLKIEKLVLSLLSQTVHICKDIHDSHLADIKYFTLEEAVSQYNNNVEITFDDESGYMKFFPKEDHIDSDKNFYYYFVAVKKNHTTFIYYCVRLGIADADYHITNYIVENCQAVWKSDDEIIERLYLEIVDKE